MLSLEHGILLKLDFALNSIFSMMQVTDLRNLPPMFGKHRAVTCQALALDSHCAAIINTSSLPAGLPSGGSGKRPLSADVHGPHSHCRIPEKLGSSPHTSKNRDDNMGSSPRSSSFSKQR